MIHFDLVLWIDKRKPERPMFIMDVGDTELFVVVRGRRCRRREARRA